MNTPVHILRYGTVAEKTHLSKALSTYDYLSINGNSAAYVSRAIAKFVVEKFFTNGNKGFIIDPITYAFQQNIHLLKNKSKSGEMALKKSIKKLLDNYQEPANKVENDAPVRPSDFTDNPSLLKEFCHRVLNFQYSIIGEYINNNDLMKYLQYATGGNSDLPCQFHPKLLIAPYFYLNPKDADYKRWLQLNIDFLDESLNQSSQHFANLDVYGQIVVSKEMLLDRRIMQDITSTYMQSNCAGFTVWVDNFNEHEENLDMVKGFIFFLQGLKGKPVYNMYGGFFSILLTHRSIQLLNGVSHGMEYGENREVYPVGGGIPVSKYYFMPLHQRKDFTKAFYLLEHTKVLDTTFRDWGNCERYYSEICDCSQCRRILENKMSNFIKFESDQYYEVKRHDTISRRKKASSETKKNCLYHYLLCKKFEFTKMKKDKLADILGSLKNEKEKYDTSIFLEPGELDYLDNWCDAISTLMAANNPGKNNA
jgi:hypothetical protein